MNLTKTANTWKNNKLFHFSIHTAISCAPSGLSGRWEGEAPASPSGVWTILHVSAGLVPRPPSGRLFPYRSGNGIIEHHGFTRRVNPICLETRRIVGRATLPDMGGSSGKGAFSTARCRASMPDL
jgi:hypothetical protein